MFSQLFQPGSPRFVIATTVVKTTEAAEQTQGDGARRRREGERISCPMEKIGDLRRVTWFVDLAIAVPTVVGIGIAYGPIRAIRYLVGLITALAVQRTFLYAMIHKIRPEKVSLADLLTLSRATTGSVLAGLVASGIRDRKGTAGWVAWVMTLLGVTLSDWLDGPLARKAGPTRLGSVLDIEADSWLTLWSAAGAVTWGDLPRGSLLPPIVRYTHPLLAFLHGELPKGGGPWWSRVTGTAQMVLIIGALAPISSGRLRNRVLAIAAIPVSTSQLVTMLVPLVKKETKNSEGLRGRYSREEHKRWKNNEIRNG